MERELIKKGTFNQFRYRKNPSENGKFMCPAGQRTAAAEAWDLLNNGGELGKQRILERAVSTEKSLVKGEGTTHSKYISYVVFSAFCDGTLEKFTDRDGNYTLYDIDKTITDANIFEDIKNGKSFRLL